MSSDLAGTTSPLLATRARRLLLVGASACLLFGQGACKTPYEQGRDILIDGQWAAQEKREAEALNQYQRAEALARQGMRQHPDDPRYPLLLAESLVAQGLLFAEQDRFAEAGHRYRKALEPAQTAFDSKKFDARAGRVLGKILLEMNRPYDAAMAWKRARAADPKSVSDEDYLTLLRIAIPTESNLDQHERALALLDELKRMVPNDPDVSPTAYRETRERLAAFKRDENDRDGALELYTKLSQEFPEHAEYHRARGELLAELGRDDEALKAFERYASSPGGDPIKRLAAMADQAKALRARGIAIKLNLKVLERMGAAPHADRANVHHKLFQLYKLVNDIDRAREQANAYLDTIKQLRKTTDLPAAFYVNLAREASNTPLEEELLEEGLKRSAPDKQLTLMLAERYAQRAQNVDVERVWRLYIDGKNATKTSQQAARRDAAEWAMRRRNWPMARALFEEITRGSDVGASDWESLAQIYGHQSDTKKLKEAVERYVAGSGRSASATRRAARLCEEHQLLEEAEGYYLKALKLEPKNLALTHNVADMYRRWSKPAKVQELYMRWIKNNGDRADDYTDIGEYLMRAQRVNEAQPYFKKAADLGDRQALSQLALIYQRQGREQDMKRVLDQYLAKAPNRGQALRDVYERLRHSNLTDSTITILREIITLYPSNNYYYDRLSDLYISQGQDRAAVELWESYLDRTGDKFNALRRMSYTFANKGRHDWMLRFYEKQLAQPNPDPRIYQLIGNTFYEIHTRRARTARRGQKAIGSEVREPLKQAERFYTKYHKEMDRSASNLLSLARDAARKHLWVLARDVYEELSKNHPTRMRNERFQYATVLLNLGDYERAEQQLDRYFDEPGGGNVSSKASKIVAKLLEFKRPRTAEKYLSKGMASASGYQINTFFRQSAQIYVQTDRTSELRGLINSYTSRASNVQQARRNIYQFTSQHGLWSLAIEQLEQITGRQSNDTSRRLAELLWYAGQYERAQAKFRDYATDRDMSSQRPWLSVADFYERHGRPKLAMQAYDAAVAAQTDSWQPLAARGRFKALQGDMTGSAADFKRAHLKADLASRERVASVQILQLLEMGQTQRAHTVARQILREPGVRKAPLLQLIASAELSSGDPVRAERIIDEMRQAAVPLDKLVNVLRKHGYLHEAAKFIEDELVVGDYVAATETLVSNADIFTTLGGIDRLMAAVQPAINRMGPDSPLYGQLGELLIREGHYAQGAVLLKASISQVNTNVDLSPMLPMLAHAQLELGQTDEAASLFQRHLLAQPEEERNKSLEHVLARYQQANQPSARRALLEQLARDPGYAGVAMPHLLDMMLDNGERARVVEALQRLAQRTASTPQAQDDLFASFQTSASVLDAFLGGLKTLANHGYLPEARTLLEQTPAALKATAEYRKARFLIDASTPGTDVKPALSALFAGLGESQEDADLRLDTARLLLITDRHDLARPIAEAELRSANVLAADHALNILCGSARVVGDLDKISGWVDAYVSASGDYVLARQKAASTLSRLGLDEQAAALQKLNVARLPSEVNVANALRTAHDQGDVKELSRLADLLWRTNRDPMKTVEGLASSWATTLPATTLQKLIAPYRKTRPMHHQMRMNAVMAHLRTGDLESARTLLKNALEQTSHDPHTAEDMLELLTVRGLFSESAKFLAPLIPEAQRTPRSSLYIGVSLAALGLDQEAKPHLDRFIKLSPDRAEAAHEATSFLLVLKRIDTAKHTLDQGLAADRNRPGLILDRARWRLASGDKDEQALKADIHAATRSGINRRLVFILLVSTASEHGALARISPLLRDWAHAPTLGQSGSSPLDSMRLMLSILGDNKSGAVVGLKFLEKHYPELLRPHNVGHNTLLPTLSNLHEEAGNSSAAFKVYEDRLRGLLLFYNSEDSGKLGEMSTYMNNLAYTFSTTNKNINKGEQMALKALALEDDRSSSVIDTLGWIYYRQGRLPEAEAEIRRAIRTHGSGSSQLPVELYQHLATIREARGDHREAVWLNIYADSLKVQQHTALR